MTSQKLLFLQRLRRVAVDDAKHQALHDRRCCDAGSPISTRLYFVQHDEHLDSTTDLLRRPDEPPETSAAWRAPSRPRASIPGPHPPARSPAAVPSRSSAPPSGDAPAQTADAPARARSLRRLDEARARSVYFSKFINHPSTGPHPDRSIESAAKPHVDWAPTGQPAKISSRNMVSPFCHADR